jgi:hypothetical protein
MVVPRPPCRRYCRRRLPPPHSCRRRYRGRHCRRRHSISTAAAAVTMAATAAADTPPPQLPPPLPWPLLPPPTSTSTAAAAVTVSCLPSGSCTGRSVAKPSLMYFLQVPVWEGWRGLRGRLSVAVPHDTRHPRQVVLWEQRCTFAGLPPRAPRPSHLSNPQAPLGHRCRPCLQPSAAHGTPTAVSACGAARSTFAAQTRLATRCARRTESPLTAPATSETALSPTSRQGTNKQRQRQCSGGSASGMPAPWDGMLAAVIPLAAAILNSTLWTGSPPPSQQSLRLPSLVVWTCRHPHALLLVLRTCTAAVLCGARGGRGWCQVLCQLGTGRGRSRPQARHYSRRQSSAAVQALPATLLLLCCT